MGGGGGGQGGAGEGWCHWCGGVFDQAAGLGGAI